MKKLQTALMLSFVAFVLLLSSFILPWYGMYNEVVRVDEDGETIRNKGGFGVTLSFFYIPIGGNGGATFYGGTSTSTIFTITAIFVILALIFIGLFLISILSRSIGKTGNTSIEKIIGILALIFCILSPVIFMIALPGAMKADAELESEYYGEDYEEPDHDYPTKSFFGNYKDVDEDWDGTRTDKVSWGGDIGWFLAFASFVIILLAFIISRSAIAVSTPLRQPYPEPPAYQLPPKPSYQEPLPPYAQAPQQVPSYIQVKCPNCSNVISVQTESFPAYIKCPYCGMKGYIE